MPQPEVALRAGEGGAGTAELRLSVSASGPAGRRVRRRRAHPATREVSPLARVRALLAGRVVRAGGVRVRVRLARAGERGWAAPPRAAGLETLWRPDDPSPGAADGGR